MSNDVGGPYLAVAVLCEKILHEKDGVLSAIRIIDRITVSPGPGAAEVMPQIPLQTQALLTFKSGIARGQYNVKLDVQNPSGKKTDIATLPVLFEGDDRGINLTLNLNFVAQEQGLYWFGVFLEDQLVTKIPLRIIYQRIGIGNPPQNH